MSVRGRTFYRYMSRAEAEAVRRTGYLRGGIPGEVFFTEDLYESADEAKRRLALPIGPQVRMRFRIVEEVDLLRAKAEVEPRYGESGGGTEYMTTGRVEVEVISVDNLE